MTTPTPAEVRALIERLKDADNGLLRGSTDEERDTEIRELAGEAATALASLLERVEKVEADEDMENVGRALMETLHDNSNHPLLKGWHPSQCPTEIVVDLLNKFDDAEKAVESELSTMRAAGTRAEGIEEAARLVEVIATNRRPVLGGNIDAIAPQLRALLTAPPAEPAWIEQVRRHLIRIRACAHVDPRVPGGNRWIAIENADALRREVSEAIALIPTEMTDVSKSATDTGPGPLQQLGDKEWRDLCEKDDRTSPAEYPEMLLITRAELGGAMSEACLLGRELAITAYLEATKAPVRDGWRLIDGRAHGPANVIGLWGDGQTASGQMRDDMWIYSDTGDEEEPPLWYMPLPNISALPNPLPASPTGEGGN